MCSETLFQNISIKKIKKKKYSEDLAATLDKWSSAVCLGAFFILCTGYIFLNARNDDWKGGFFLFILLAIILSRLLITSSDPVTINKKIVSCFWGYLMIALASVLFPTTSLFHSIWLVKSFYRFALVLVILQVFWVNIKIERKVIRWLLPALCLTLGVIAILTGYGLLAKHKLSFITPWTIINNAWNEKAFSFYMIFLMWAAIAYLWRRTVSESIFSIIIFGITLWGVFLYSSESSQLAIVCGALVFGLAHIKFQRKRYLIYLSAFMMFMLLPLLWVVFTPVMPMKATTVFSDSSSFLRHHWNIGARLFLNDFSAEFVRNNLFLGHGFGSTLSITFPKEMLPGLELPGRMPGGHPHNIIFLILIDHGLLGLLWMSGMLYVLFDYLYNATLNRKEAPALWALLISGQIIFSLSFDIWNADVVLIYGLFFIFVMMVSRLSEYKGTTVARERVFHATQGLVLLIFVCYVVNYFLLSPA